LNDKQHFCENCWTIFHEGQHEIEKEDISRNKTIAEFLRNHERVEYEHRPKDFGTCINHEGRKNEYYNNITSQAYCSMCVVDGLQKVDSSSTKTNQSSLIAIEKAYSNAYDDAMKDDI
jgi:hypothetical protein